MTLTSSAPQDALLSELPPNPIEDPDTWAWGEPPNGISYKAKDSLSLEVCLANPSLINTVKCSLPLEVCLSNPQYLPLLGCSGHTVPLGVFLKNPQLLIKTQCSDYKLPLQTCLENTELLPTSACSGEIEKQLDFLMLKL